VAVAADTSKTRRKAAGPQLRVTWVRSTIGHTQATRGTIRALGLRRLHQTVEIADTPENRGMVRRAAFLLEVEEPGSAKGAAAKEEESA
jgi:large subunit ribosomal protein L30